MLCLYLSRPLTTSWRTFSFNYENSFISVSFLYIFVKQCIMTL